MAGSLKLQVDIEIPSEVEVKLDGAEVTVIGPKGTSTRLLYYPSISINSKEDKVTVTAKAKTKVLRAIKGAYVAHIRNMVQGVTKGFEYKLKVLYSHFPMTVKQNGDVITIDNFLGEKTPRRSKILGNCSIAVKGDSITVSGINLEDVAQTAANIELATKVKGRDRRVFQDGIYLISKGVMA